MPKVRDPVASQGQVSYSQAVNGMGSEYVTELSNRVLSLNAAMIYPGNIARLFSQVHLCQCHRQSCVVVSIEFDDIGD
jgi:hypothetical protein